MSYAAGLAGISPWRVGLGTLIGMAPLCYLQAYAAETLFAILPGSGLLLLGLGAAYVVLVAILLITTLRSPRGRRRGPPEVQ